MPLQDELRELFERVGPRAFDDADTFRGAFDDFVPEGAATPGELRLLVDAIATGSFQRLLTQLGISADPETAIAAEAERLARDRGTMETDGARWALSALAYARGLTERVTTRPSALGVPSVPRPEDEQVSSTGARGDDGTTYVAPTSNVPPPPPPPPPPTSTPPPPPPSSDVPPTEHRPPSAPPPAVPSAAPSSHRRKRPIAAIVAVLVALAVVAVVAVVLLGKDDPDDNDETAGDDSSASHNGGAQHEDVGSGGSLFPPPPADLPPLPAGYPTTLAFDVRLPTELAQTTTSRFGPGVATEVFSGGDPTEPGVQAESGPQPTARRVSELLAAGIPPRVKFYSLRQVGQGGSDASGGDLLDLLQDEEEMAAYWTNVRELLTALNEVDGPVEMVVEPDVPGEILSSSPDATAVPAAVASSGVAGLQGLPDTFAGWAQAWLQLRDELAPQVRVGLTVSPWQINNDFLPDPPSHGQAAEWAEMFGESYATLGAHFDFLDNIMTYQEGGSLGAKYIADDRFFGRLLTWVEGISTATGTRVVLDNVPVGNSVYRTMDDTEFHYRDSWVEWILADPEFTNLVALRDAGVIGIVFGSDASAESSTCPCDAAGDGVTNGGRSGDRSTSADDDGGYLAERLQAYAGTGGVPL